MGPRGELLASGFPELRIRLSERGMAKQQPEIQTPSAFGSSLSVRGEEITGTLKAPRNDEICVCLVMCKRFAFY